MVFSSTLDGIEGNGPVKGHKSTMMTNREGKQIQIGQLAWTVNSSGVDDAIFQKTDIVRPEFMERGPRGFDEAFVNRGNRHWVRIVCVRHDPHAAVLGRGTRCPAGFGMS